MRKLAAAFLFCAALAVTALPGAPAAPRIVVLVPSFADDLAALHAEGLVAGVSAYTEGSAYAGVPRVSDFQSVDVERILALHPTVVFGIPAQARFTAPLRAAGIRVQLLPDDSYGDIFRDLRALGVAAERPSESAALERSWRARTAALRARASHFHRRPSVFIVLGTGPVWSAGPQTYIGTLIGFAGGVDAAASLGGGWGQFSEEALLAAQPDALISGTGEHLDRVLDREPWRSLRAVQRHHVYVLRDPNLLYRPGPAYNDGLQWLIERLTPLST